MKKLHKLGTTILLALAPASALGVITGIIISNINPSKPEPTTELKINQISTGSNLTSFDWKGGYGKETVITFEAPDPTKYTIDFNTLCLSYTDETSQEIKYLKIGEKGAEGTEAYINDDKLGVTITAEGSKHKVIDFVLCSDEVLTPITAQDFATEYGKARDNFFQNYPQGPQLFSVLNCFAKEYQSNEMHEYTYYSDEEIPLTFHNGDPKLLYPGSSHPHAAKFYEVVEERTYTDPQGQVITTHPFACNDVAHVQAYISMWN